MTESTQTTQARYPGRAVLRTVFAAVIALAALMPALVSASGAGETSAAAGGVLAIAGAITRIMAVPGVNDFLQRFVPWLAAAPK